MTAKKNEQKPLLDGRPLVDEETTSKPSPNEEALGRELESKIMECAKLYRLVNLYKERITKLEIDIIDRDIQIEQLGSVLKNHERGTRPVPAVVKEN